jgi:hypothetical protein
MLVVPDHAENQLPFRRSLDARLQRIIHPAAVGSGNQHHRRPGREPEQAGPHPPGADQMGRRVQHHRDHRPGQRLPLMLAPRSHAAKLTHDRVKSVIHGHAHRHRRIDRGPLRPGPHPLLADLLIGRNAGGGYARGHRAQCPPSLVNHGGAGLHTEPCGQGHSGQADHRCQVDPGVGWNPHAEQGSHLRSRAPPIREPGCTAKTQPAGRPPE